MLVNLWEVPTDAGVLDGCVDGDVEEIMGGDHALGYSPGEVLHLWADVAEECVTGPIKQ